MNNESFNKYIEQTIKENWERIALSDFDGVSYHYKDIARKIAKIHLLLESAEIKKGDKNSYLRQKLSSLGGSLFCGNHLRSRARPHLT